MRFAGSVDYEGSHIAIILIRNVCEYVYTRKTNLSYSKFSFASHK